MGAVIAVTAAMERRHWWRPTDNAPSRERAREVGEDWPEVRAQGALLT